MRRTLITLALFTAAAPATCAQTSRAWGNLQVTLESCFRASSGTDSGCNVVLTNTGPQPVSVRLDAARDTVTLPDSVTTEAKSVILGGDEQRYSVTKVIPAGNSMRGQLNYNVTKGVTTLQALRVGEAEFRNVPLARDIPAEPAVNLPQPAVTTDETDQIRLTFLDCVRSGTQVTCSFAMSSQTDDPLRVTSQSYDVTWALTRTGLVQAGSQVTLGGQTERYSVTSFLPARRALLSQVTFTLPEGDTFVPYLQLNNYAFRSLPIISAPGPRALNSGGDLVNTYRLRDYSGTVDGCAYARGGLRCSFTLTNRTEEGYRLTTSADDLRLLTPDGRWFGTTSLTAGGQTAPYSAEIPLPARQTGTLSVLFGAPDNLTNIPFLSVGGLEFENVPVK